MTKRKSQINCAYAGLQNWVKFVSHTTELIWKQTSWKEEDSE